MTHAEFHCRACALYPGDHVHTRVDVATADELYGGKTTVTYSCYCRYMRGGHGWTDDYPTPEAALRAFAMTCAEESAASDDIETLGDAAAELEAKL